MFEYCFYYYFIGKDIFCLQKWNREEIEFLRDKFLDGEGVKGML